LVKLIAKGFRKSAFSVSSRVNSAFDI